MKKYLLNTKSQAAVEFLITYGWVILGVMITVGALAYFGVFNTDRFVNDECNFGSQLYCEDFILASNGRLILMLRNNFGQPISVGVASFAYDGVPFASSCLTPLDLDSGAAGQYRCDLDNTFPINEKIKLKVTIQFNRDVVGAPSHNVTGTIVATAQ
jgi:hypothetical protein